MWLVSHLQLLETILVRSDACVSHLCCCYHYIFVSKGGHGTAFANVVKT